MAKMKGGGFRGYMEDTMMSQSKIKPAPEMVRAAKDMAKKDMPMKKKSMPMKPKKGTGY